MSSADKVFGNIAYEMRLITSDRVRQAYAHAKSLGIGLSAYFAQTGEIHPDTQRKILVARAQFGRLCTACGEMTFLLPGQLVDRTPCEHCGGKLGRTSADVGPQNAGSGTYPVAGPPVQTQSLQQAGSGAYPAVSTGSGRIPHAQRPGPPQRRPHRPASGVIPIPKLSRPAAKPTAAVGPAEPQALPAGGGLDDAMRGFSFDASTAPPAMKMPAQAPPSRPMMKRMGPPARARTGMIPVPQIPGENAPLPEATPEPLPSPPAAIVPPASPPTMKQKRLVPAKPPESQKMKRPPGSQTMKRPPAKAPVPANKPPPTMKQKRPVAETAQAPRPEVEEPRPDASMYLDIDDDAGAAVDTPSKDAEIKKKAAELPPVKADKEPEPEPSLPVTMEDDELVFLDQAPSELSTKSKKDTRPLPPRPTKKSGRIPRQVDDGERPERKKRKPSPKSGRIPRAAALKQPKGPSGKLIGGGKTQRIPRIDQAGKIKIVGMPELKDEKGKEVEASPTDSVGGTGFVTFGRSGVFKASDVFKDGDATLEIGIVGKKEKLIPRDKPKEKPKPTDSLVDLAFEIDDAKSEKEKAKEKKKTKTSSRLEPKGPSTQKRKRVVDVVNKEPRPNLGTSDPGTGQRVLQRVGIAVVAVALVAGLVLGAKRLFAPVYNWYPDEAKAREGARSAGKPLVKVIVDPKDPVSREFQKDVLMAPEVKVLRGEFVWFKEEARAASLKSPPPHVFIYASDGNSLLRRHLRGGELTAGAFAKLLSDTKGK